jgi:hypothetical protein
MTRRLMVLVLVTAMLGLSACARKATPPPPPPPAMDAAGLLREIQQSTGLMLVLFRAAAEARSTEMYEVVSPLASRYQGQVQVKTFIYDAGTDKNLFTLEVLPTLVMYRDGKEVDRMRGAPVREQERRDILDDLDLWVLSTGLQYQLEGFRGDFRYQYNNTNRLQIMN